MNDIQIKAIQQQLRDAGHPITIDGVLGPETLEAMRAQLEIRGAGLDTRRPKPAWASRTIVGALVVILSQAARLMWPEVDVDVGATVDGILSIVGIAGGALAWYGRIRADRTIGAPGGDAGSGGQRVRGVPSDARDVSGRSAPRRADGPDDFWSRTSDDHFLGG